MKSKIDEILERVQKPGRYCGGELGSVVKNADETELRFCFCFPDTYEVGMSHLGSKILYNVINKIDGVWCERAYSPWIDMEKELRSEGVKLFSHESRTPLSEFDILGFTLQYELSYTNILNMLELSGIPLLAKERGSDQPIIIAGGPCACNPEPLADFIDIFVLGEGEEVTPELCKLMKQCKAEGLQKEELLKRACGIEGIYVPAFYDVDYNEDGTIASVKASNGAPARVKKRIVADFDSAEFATDVVVPMIEVVHDRAMTEVLRGCIRGCRFCQAGYIYRPFREKKPETISCQARELCENTGYDEVSLTSLSTSDYSELERLLDLLLDWSVKSRVNLSLPSLRVDNFSESLLRKTTKVKKSGLTFAPEAGTQRLRDVINKNVSEEELERTCTLAFDGGYTNIKLYFMMGLPTETMEDIEGIASLAQRVVDMYYKNPNKQKGRSVGVSVSVATFVPKPFTPFQYEPQDTIESIEQKQRHLRECVKSRKISVSWHDPRTSLIEAVFARGDRRVGRLLLEAYRLGCEFDGWNDCFDYDKWLEAEKKSGISFDFYANRTRGYDEVMPWSHIDYGVSEKYLAHENMLSKRAETTPPCNVKCSGCGVNKAFGRECFGNL